MVSCMTAKRWLLRRFSLLVDLLHQPRHVSRRLALLGCAIFLLIFFNFFRWPNSQPRQPATEHCVDEYLVRRGLAHPIESEDGKMDDQWWREARVAFLGNGFIALDAAAGEPKLILLGNESGRSHVLTDFYPLVDVQMPIAAQLDSIVFTDVKDGVARSLHCSNVVDKCVCVVQTIYAHRTRPNLLVQEIRVVNPSASSFSITFGRRKTEWESRESHPSPVYTKILNGKVALAIMCTSIPGTNVAIKPKVEETFRFMCVLENEENAGKAIGKIDELVRDVSAHFSRLFSIPTDQLDAEHAAAWKSLNSAALRISHSKAPNALNQAQIDAVQHALLSSVRAPLLEGGNWSSEKSRKEAEKSLARDSELCYSGHSTLLSPSKLWQKWTDTRSLLKILDIWKMTLEHRGCVRLMRGHAGAHGVMQAFLLSLCAATFTSGGGGAIGKLVGQGDGKMKLEVGLDPESELHRQLRIEGLRVGRAQLAMHFQLDVGLKPYITLRNSAPNPEATPLFACTAGCLETPHSLGTKPTSLAIKVTRPKTPILFVSEHKGQLEMVQKTLHVSEVVDAPAHEQQTLDIHKHGAGGSGGLPTLFWAVLAIVLVAFHLFLFKLLYTEWRNSSAVPYAKFNRKVLFRRE